MSTITLDTSVLRERVWKGSIPLEIWLARDESRTYDQTDPYIIYAPRLSYLPFLLPQLYEFFLPSLINPHTSFYNGWFSFEEVPLKWHNPLGLLFDLYAGIEAAYPKTSRQNLTDTDTKKNTDSNLKFETVPWKLNVHFHDWPVESLVRLDPDGKVLHDSFVNSVKEADFLRNGSAKAVMSLSKDDSTRLWISVQDHDLRGFDAVHQKLLAPPGTQLRHIPIKIYLPSSISTKTEESTNLGALRVVQSLVTPMIGSRQQTVGSALNTLLPTLFPSKRTILFAEPVLHGAVIPLNAPVGELSKLAAFADGWLHIGIVMLA